ncbi:hypothetical protein LAZ67_2005069 [Cordylochernes scorpioides]|uniref:Uncharacterized protein n=1 Tax=Cordylochernes scorpioides TaxID=51811 RepID=A0ABY6K434_9ARAC|nr:hypothetical protein LAZ67_2005069 [Cordylochernes scorpioides]
MGLRPSVLRYVSVHCGATYSMSSCKPQFDSVSGDLCRHGSPPECPVESPVEMEESKALQNFPAIGSSTAALHTQDRGHCDCCYRDVWRHLSLLIGHGNSNTVYTPKIEDITTAIIEMYGDI